MVFETSSQLPLCRVTFTVPEGLGQGLRLKVGKQQRDLNSNEARAHHLLWAARGACTWPVGLTSLLVTLEGFNITCKIALVCRSMQGVVYVINMPMLLRCYFQTVGLHLSRCCRVSLRCRAYGALTMACIALVTRLPCVGLRAPQRQHVFAKVDCSETRLDSSVAMRPSTQDAVSHFNRQNQRNSACLCYVHVLFDCYSYFAW